MTRDEMIKIVARTMGDRNPDAYFYTASAVLTAIEAAGGWAPEGYAVVSVEPDEDCLERGADAYHHVWMMRKDEKITAGLLAGQPRPIFPNDWLRDVYRAMIAAAKE